ncbi:TerB family tellurite resistance protein [Jannaschia aquimarina]|uniref:DjlA protein n=1 Tax=Jannaschia aquimarina TaxID=935700 RepID=A0A0D1EI64_9RHOB|nr:TerB family tellurite resistance protein [Jannaschia aquimarina]KIT15535.1 DnaJ-like protein DjlA [Jannaschia aquimarina]SNT34671.1 DnaJ like chaperone protein [Jannaschia aquimarina]
MSLWSRILDALARLAPGEALTAIFDRLRGPPERSVAFTIAVIALGAKMAKADGMVTRAEVAAFREVFHIPPDEEDNAARVFDLARTDVAGFDDYARRIKAMFPDDDPILRDLMEGLFHIAMADGHYHPAEDEFLGHVADIFALSEREFRALRARFTPGQEPDPFDMLGLDPDATLEEARAAWRRAVRDTHPDALMARGLPEEAIKLAEKRLIAINRAWEQIQAEAA